MANGSVRPAFEQAPEPGKGGPRTRKTSYASKVTEGSHVSSPEGFVIAEERARSVAANRVKSEAGILKDKQRHSLSKTLPPKKPRSLTDNSRLVGIKN